MKTFKCWDAYDGPDTAREVKVEDHQGPREAASRWAERAFGRQERMSTFNYDVLVQEGDAGPTKWEVDIELSWYAHAVPVDEKVPA